MRVLVTGARGFIGAPVVRALLERGHEVTASQRAEVVGAPEHGERAEWIAADLDDAAAVERLVARARPEVAVHMAWYADPATYLRSPRNMDSLAATARLARVLFEHGCRRIVGAGTCVEYRLEERPLRESDVVEPRTVYGAAKRAAFLAVDALAKQEGRELVWARIFHIHGPRDAPNRLIPSVVGRLVRGEPVELTDGAQRRDHLHVADIAAAMAALVEGSVLGPVNVCSGEPVTLRRVVEVAAGAVGRPDLLRFGARPRRPDDAGYLAGDASRLRQTGWSPRFGLIDGIEDAVAWELSRLR